MIIGTSPIGKSLLADPVRLSGKVMQWQWVRSFSPFINLYTAIPLIGGAIVSAARFRSMPEIAGSVESRLELGAAL